MALRRSTHRYIIWGLAGYLGYHFLVAHKR